MTILSKNIKQLREIRGWSQADLARVSGVSYTTITKLEIGVIREPSVEKLTKIATALSVTVDQLKQNIHSHGASNAKGINAQVWSAASLFFQYCAFSDFEKIELESPFFEDFNLVFTGNKRIVVEVKLREEKFNLSDLRDLYQKLLKKGGLLDNDEILIIAKNFSKDVKDTITYFRYSIEEFRLKLIEKGFDKASLELFNRTKLWDIDFGDKEAKEVAYYMLVKLIDYGASSSDTEKLFNSLLQTKFFEGAANGASYTKKDIYEEIQREKSRFVKGDGRYDSDVDALDVLLVKLQEECGKVQSRLKSDLKIDHAVTAISANPNLMNYVLHRLETINDLDFNLIKPLLELNKNYLYAFSVERILEKNLNNTENVEIALEYLEKNIASLIIIRTGQYWISDLADITSKIIQFDPTYSQRVANILIEALIKLRTDFLYIKSKSDSYQLSKLLTTSVKLLPIVDSSLRNSLYNQIISNYPVSDRDHDHEAERGNALYAFILEYLKLEYPMKLQERIDSIVNVIANEYTQELKKYGSSIAFDGFDSLSTVHSWHGDEYSVSDRAYIDGILAPLLNEFYSTDEVQFWKYVENDILSKPVSAENPDFLRRALIPFLVDMYFKTNSASNEKKVFNYLSSFLKEKSGVLSKSELIYQYIYKSHLSTDLKLVKLLKISLQQAKTPVNPFVEKLTRSLSKLGDRKIANWAKKIIIEWVTNPAYRKNRHWLHDDFRNHLESLVDTDLDVVVEALSNSLKEGYLDAIDTFHTYEFAKIIRSVLMKSFEKGYLVLTILLNKEELSEREQIALLYGLYSIGEKEGYTSEYLNNVYTQFIYPICEKFNNVDALCSWLTNANAREAFIDIAEAIASNDSVPKNMEKVMYILNFFSDDPDPYLPGKDPKDPEAKYSEHKRILSGDSTYSISTVRGKVADCLAYVLSPLGRDNVSGVIKIAEKLIPDKDLHVFGLLGRTIERLGKSRNWVVTEGSNELFLSSDEKEAIRLSQKIKELAFAYIERYVQMPSLAQNALKDPVSMAFYGIRDLNTVETVRLLDLIGKLPPSAITSFAPYYIYFAFYRKETVFSNAKNITTENFDEELITNIFISTMIQKGDEFQQSVIFQLKDLLKNKPSSKLRLIKIVKMIIKQFEYNKFEALFRFLEDVIEPDFELFFEIFYGALTVQHQYLVKLDDKKRIELQRLNYFFEFESFLSKIYEKKGESVFVDTLVLMFDVPISVFIYQLDQLKPILLNLKDRSKAEYLFKVLCKNVSPTYIDTFIEWKKINKEQ